MATYPIRHAHLLGFPPDTEMWIDEAGHLHIECPDELGPSVLQRLEELGHSVLSVEQYVDAEEWETVEKAPLLLMKGT